MLEIAFFRCGSFVVVSRPLLRDGGMTMVPQKPGNSPGPGPEVVERQRAIKERAMKIEERTRENTASLTREHKFLDGDQGNLYVE